MYLGDILKLMALAEAQKNRMRPKSIHKTDLIDGVLTTSETNEQTYALNEEILICSNDLLDMTTNSEWILVRKIMKELHMNNCIWYCSPEYKNSSSTIKAALRGLLNKSVLWNTDKKHYYIINPVYLRKGNLVFGLITTAQAIYNNKGIDDSVLRPLKRIQQFRFSGDIASELSKPITQSIATRVDLNDQNGLYGLEF